MSEKELDSPAGSVVVRLGGSREPVSAPALASIVADLLHTRHKLLKAEIIEVETLLKRLRAS